MKAIHTFHILFAKICVKNIRNKVTTQHPYRKLLVNKA